MNGMRTGIDGNVALTWTIVFRRSRWRCLIVRKQFAPRGSSIDMNRDIQSHSRMRIFNFPTEFAVHSFTHASKNGRTMPLLIFLSAYIRAK